MPGVPPATLSPSTSPKSAPKLSQSSSSATLNRQGGSRTDLRLPRDAAYDHAQLAGILGRVSSGHLSPQVSAASKSKPKQKRGLLHMLRSHDSSKHTMVKRKSASTGSTHSADETLRHVETPTIKPNPAQKKLLVRVFRQNGTFGTFAAPIDATATQLIMLAARKFFIADPENYRIKFDRPDHPSYFSPSDLPVKAFHDLAHASGYPHHGREDLSFLGRFILEPQESEQDRLDALVIKHGRLRLIDWADESFPPEFLAEQGPAIESIELYNCSLNTLPQLAPSTPNVKMCRIRDTVSLKSILPAGTITFAQLQTLDLRRNGLAELNIDFKSLPDLKALDISGNQLESLPESLRVCPLRSLFASTNKLSNFDMFNPLLEELNLDYNLISYFGPSISNAKNLRRLHLAFNSFTRVPAQLEFTENLAFLDITGNHISQIGQIRSLTVSHLKMGYNSINSCTNEEAQVRQRDLMAPYLYLPNLSVADIQYCGRPFVQTPYFPLVTVLNLPGQKLTKLAEGLIDALPNLITLNVASNKITMLPSAIGKCRHLTSLDISNNSVMHLPPEITQLSKLVTLTAHCNNLKSLPAFSFRLRALRSLNLSSNLFESLEFLDVRHSVASRRNSVTSWSSESSAESFLAGDELQFSALETLIMADNRLGDEIFDQLVHAPNLKILNLSHNDISELTPGTVSKLTDLEKLYMSGNRISTLPQDELGKLTKLRELYLNSNRLHTIPADISSLKLLEIFDVANNNLHYNVCNWPFDWNWRWNKQLRYLNFSANRRLEIKRVDRSRQEDLTDFNTLPNMVILGLMDVTLLRPKTPEETEDCRVRTSGSDFSNFSHSIADIMGDGPLGIYDIVNDYYRSSPNELLMGIFEGQQKSTAHGNRIASLVRELIPTTFKNELEVDENDVRGAFERTLDLVHAEIGNTVVLSPQELPHSPLAQHHPTALRFDDSDKSAGVCMILGFLRLRRAHIISLGSIQIVLSKADGSHKVLNESHDTKNRAELDRVRESDAVIVDHKINGVTESTRMLGYYSLGQSVHHKPQYIEFELDVDDIMVGATSEFWKYLDYATAADISRGEAGNTTAAAFKLRDLAISYGCSKAVQVCVFSSKVDEHNEMSKAKRKHGLPQDSLLARLGGEIAPPLGDVTLVFTDICQSTYLWETMPAVMRNAIKTHNSIMRRSIRLMSGYEVKTEGDAFIVAFHTPTEALLWCLSVQQQLLVAEWPPVLLEHDEGRPTYIDGSLVFQGFRVRMGLHRGRPVCEQDPITGRMDYFGPMVNKTARISSVAHAGQVTISKTVLDYIETTEDDPKSIQQLNDLGFVSVDIGELKLKGIENPENIFAVYPKSLAARTRHDWGESNEVERNPVVISRHKSSVSSIWSNGRNSGYEMSPRVSVAEDRDAGIVLGSILHRLESLSTRLRGGSLSLGDLSLFTRAIESPEQFEVLINRLENVVTALAVNLVTPDLEMNQLLALLRTVRV